jgi:hypothetical protein
MLVRSAGDLISIWERKHLISDILMPSCFSVSSDPVNYLLTDKYYQYEHSDLHTEHSVVHRSISSEERESSILEGKPSTKVSEIVQLTSTPPSLGGSLPASTGSYITRERNVTVVNPQDSNQTSWIMANASSDTSPLPQSNITAFSSTVALQNNTNSGKLAASFHSFFLSSSSSSRQFN